MASLTFAAAVIPATPIFNSFSTRPFFTPRFLPSPKSLSPRFTIKSSFKDAAAAALIATAASAALSSNAMAIEVLLGTDSGQLAFVPKNFSVPSGEKIVFVNHMGFPHNVVFDEDGVPPGVDVAKISMSDEDLLNARDETFSVTLTEKGEYKFYCTPHQGAGMYGTVTVY